MVGRLYKKIQWLVEATYNIPEFVHGRFRRFQDTLDAPPPKRRKNSGKAQGELDNIGWSTQSVRVVEADNWATKNNIEHWGVELNQ